MSEGFSEHAELLLDAITGSKEPFNSKFLKTYKSVPGANEIFVELPNDKIALTKKAMAIVLERIEISKQLRQVNLRLAPSQEGNEAGQAS